nr:MAG TPA: transposase [Caudoviricetes sp.]
MNQLVSNNINTLVIGHTNYWKQDTKLGKRTNQNFIQIPFNKLIQMLSYKCKLFGINCVI